MNSFRHTLWHADRPFWFQPSVWLLVAGGAAAAIGACGGGAGEGTGFSSSGGLVDDSGTPPNLVQSGDGGSSGGSKGDGSTSPPPAITPCDPASCTAGGGSCVSNVCTIKENPGSVSAATQATLTAGGSGDASFQWLYPYDKTVFPKRLLPPKMQFAGAAADAYYVHITAPNIDYRGFFAGAAPSNVTLSAAVWDAIGGSAHAKDVIKVEVTKQKGATVAGPIAETWRFAQGSAKGTIYYETYGSALAGGAASVGIMRIDPGASKPTVLKQGCGNVCHTASADGSTLVAATSLLGSASYDLRNNAAVISNQGSQSFTYGALTPDGKMLMSATDYRTHLGGPSRLYDSHTGALLPAPGWDGVVTRSGTPAFSPDGKFIAFNHEDKGAGRTLAVMNVNLATRTFSGLQDVASDPTKTLGWPAFTPDSKSIIYHAGSQPQFETDANAVGDLFISDLANHKITRLDAANGYAGGKSYLPANDPALNFAPTVLPEAVGGYFWVVFTSHRAYGNTLPSKDNGDQNGKLWVAAIDIDAPAGVDPSHPAFYLDGQEASADNLRGFWVLSPCKANGAGCQGGDECCGGFCRGEGGSAPVCVSPPGGCSNELEACKTSSDCCVSTMACINGRCATPGPN